MRPSILAIRYLFVLTIPLKRDKINSTNYGKAAQSRKRKGDIRLKKENQKSPESAAKHAKGTGFRRFMRRANRGIILGAILLAILTSYIIYDEVSFANGKSKILDLVSDMLTEAFEFSELTSELKLGDTVPEDTQAQFLAQYEEFLDKYFTDDVVFEFNNGVTKENAAETFKAFFASAVSSVVTDMTTKVERTNARIEKYGPSAAFVRLSMECSYNYVGSGTFPSLGIRGDYKDDSGGIIGGDYDTGDTDVIYSDTYYYENSPAMRSVQNYTVAAYVKLEDGEWRVSTVRMYMGGFSSSVVDDKIDALLADTEAAAKKFLSNSSDTLKQIYELSSDPMQALEAAKKFESSYVHEYKGTNEYATLFSDHARLLGDETLYDNGINNYVRFSDTDITFSEFEFTADSKTNDEYGNSIVLYTVTANVKAQLKPGAIYFDTPIFSTEVNEDGSVKATVQYTIEVRYSQRYGDMRISFFEMLGVYMPGEGGEV